MLTERNVLQKRISRSIGDGCMEIDHAARSYAVFTKVRFFLFNNCKCDYVVDVWGCFRTCTQILVFIK
jgi:hypothetical protein